MFNLKGENGKFEQRKDWAMGLMLALRLGTPWARRLNSSGRERDDYITKYMTGGAHGVSKGEFTDDIHGHHG